MNPTRKTIILQEILFWKENNMLPDQYCDYLLALYSEGKEDGRGSMKKSGKSRIDIWSISLLPIMIAISLLVTYFTQLPFLMQTVMMLIFVSLVLFFLIYHGRRGKPVLLYQITAAFLVLLYTVKVNEILFGNSAVSLYGLLFAQCLIWLVIGIWRKIYF
ncbi:MAG TPA: hypothetical protein VIG80_01650, partial [Bacillaceae bacterium]